MNILESAQMLVTQKHTLALILRSMDICHWLDEGVTFGVTEISSSGEQDSVTLSSPPAACWATQRADTFPQQ